MPIGGGGFFKKCCRIVALALKFVQYCTLLLIVHHIDIPAVFDCQLLWNIGVTRLLIRWSWVRVPADPPVFATSDRPKVGYGILVTPL